VGEHFAAISPCAAQTLNLKKVYFGIAVSRQKAVWFSAVIVVMC
jgi:hypothetical protein